MVVTTKFSRIPSNSVRKRSTLGIVAHDHDDSTTSYQYLAESIRMHPSQEEFKQMLESVNFKNVSYDIMTVGIVTLHIAEK